jgi:hypothetical protein
MRFLRRHWPAIVGIFANLPTFFAWVVSLFDWGARVDLVVAKLHEAGGVSGVLAFLLNPPPWFLGTTLIVGLALFYWDSRRRYREPKLPELPLPPRDKPEEIDPAKLPLRDVKLVDAIWRIFMGQWNVKPEKSITIPEPEAVRFALVCIDVRQQAFDGKLPIWATRKKSWLYEPLPRDYWRNKEIIASFMMNAVQNETLVVLTHPLKIGEIKGQMSTEWENFMTNRETVERLWPAKGP